MYGYVHSSYNHVHTRSPATVRVAVGGGVWGAGDGRGGCGGGGCGCGGGWGGGGGRGGDRRRDDDHAFAGRCDAVGAAGRENGAGHAAEHDQMNACESRHENLRSAERPPGALMKDKPGSWERKRPDRKSTRLNSSH